METNSPDHIFAGLGPLVLANLPHCQSVQWFGMQKTDKNIYKFKKQKKVLPWQSLLGVKGLKVLFKVLLHPQLKHA